MTEEPYRWLEAIANRREYVLNQIKDGSPVLAASLPEGILVIGIGTGQSKVFEVFDRHALAGLGHPADLERIRQALIDAAHIEAFTRAPEDVALRRLVSFSLGPQLKTAFEQIFAPPFLLRLLLAELGNAPERDSLVKVNFDGTFHLQHGGCAVVAGDAALESPAEAWLAGRLKPDSSVADAGRLLLTTWRSLVTGSPLPGPDEMAPAQPGDLARAQGSAPVLEAALLRRSSTRAARFEFLPTDGWPATPSG